MSLTPERIEAFKRLYSERYGVELSDQEALDRAIRFVSLIGVVLKESARYMPQQRAPSPTR